MGVRMPLRTTLCVVLTALVVFSSAAVSAGPLHQLRRRPYLTDLTQHHVLINWATTRAVADSWVRYGRAGSGSCASRRAEATRRKIVVGKVAEYQWRASLGGLRANTRYCYRVFADGTRLGDTARFRTQVRSGSSAPFSFAVLGDWGAVDAHGQNPHQAAVLRQIAQSPARFAVTTGDTGYDDGSQRNYGDLVQTGAQTSGVFGPSFWARAGWLDRDVQRAGQPRPERDRARSTGPSRVSCPRRTAATPWRGTAA